MSPWVTPLTRRHAAAGIAATIGVFLIGQRIRAQESSLKTKPAATPSNTRTSIHYDLDFKTSPKRMYETILDAKQFAEFSGMTATIDPAVGGAFSMFGGVIVGRNIELVPDQRIVQAWRPTYWPAGVYSLVHFELAAKGAYTSLAFDHTGFPEGDHDSLDRGWESHYWAPLRKYFATSAS